MTEFSNPAVGSEDSGTRHQAREARGDQTAFHTALLMSQSPDVSEP